jgi:hypothetical protein
MPPGAAFIPTAAGPRGGGGRRRRQGRISGRLTRFGGDQALCSQRRGNRLSESFWGVLNADGVGAP